ncbi:hypothetical protein SAMN06265367_10870 [Algoriphagus winogradskyi]|uniref:Uncharacterized protein n=1 Tax=Algoriphagus winogradskyi TaxID=237017 RepID=A0ABY1PES3_9BACT|nr:hypothetical protein SAMN06265367_10870 [Algoriphagus winogradskyi]
MMPVTLDSLLIKLIDLSIATGRLKTPALAGQAEVATILKVNISYIAFTTILVKRRIYILSKNNFEIFL